MVITTEDVETGPIERIKSGDEEFRVDTSELSFPNTMHHFAVQARVNALADHGVITHKRAEELYTDWLEDR